MPNWEGIEDASLHASRVWLSRLRDPTSDNNNSSSCVAAEKAASSSKSKKNKNDSSNSSSSYYSTGWLPLRKCDCLALNENSSKPMLIESGRCTADPVSGKIFFNFMRGPERELTSAVWFVRLPKAAAAAASSSSSADHPSTAKVETGSSTKSSSSASKKDYVLVPIADKEDSDKIETLYKRAIAASSSLGKGVSSMLTADEAITLKDASKVQLVLRSGSDMLSIKRTPQPGLWFAPQPQVLQRGYGEYTVDGEEDEALLGPVKSLVFVVHGIGEAMFSRDDVKMPSLTEQMHTLRMATQKRQVELWKAECHAAEKAGLTTLPSPPNRIEFLPIEWFNRLHDSSTDLMKSLKAVSLPSIPALRAIANDIVFDVLLYLTPTFCEAVLECVTDQVNALYKGFQQVHKNFLQNGGTVSFIGHSLGSVIVWDLLSVLKDAREEESLHVVGNNFTGVSINGQVGYRTYANHENANQAVNGSWGPSLPKKMKECISFTPANTIFIGSPIGMFLTLRGAHAVFDAMRQEAVENVKKMAQEASVAAAQAIVAAAAALPAPPDGGGTTTSSRAKPATVAVAAKAATTVVEIPMASPFALPTGALYNIFHPSDPVAYRIEPLLLAQGTDVTSLPPPLYLTAPGKDVRLHLQAKRFGEAFSKSLIEHKSTWNALIETAVSFVTPDSPKKDTTDKSSEQKPQFKEGPLRFPLGGKSERVDLSFQPGVIENEYISAVLAHSTASYFTHSDFQDFLIKLVDPPSPEPPPIEKVEAI